MTIPLIVPNSEPFYIPRGPVGCLLLHGFTSMPEEMHGFGTDLAQHGYTVLGLRLPGHATTPHDLERVRSTDWLVTVEEGLALLRGNTERVVIIGQSFGGNLALLAAARYPVSSVIAIASPYPEPLSPIQRWLFRAVQKLRPTIHKPGIQAHPELGVRREAEYPAYVEYPARIIWELFKIQKMMQAELPQVHVPVMVMHSKDDPVVPAAGAQRIYDQLGSPEKQLIWLEGFGHGVTAHPRRGEVVELVAKFIARTMP